MPLFAFEGAEPTVHETAWIAPTAALIGDVRVEAEASVWYGAVLRADFGPIIIRAGANVQDNSVLHGGADPLIVGPGTTVGHLCVIHNCVIGAESIIGNGATVQDGARIGDHCMIGAGSLVTPNMVIPDDQLVLGAPAKIKGPLTESAGWWVKTNPALYRELAARHSVGAPELGGPA
ncbi:gamma carbonic anhydrase family protein [Pseudonocardia spinosispora]|uniref:gamma carbonic anhydrase family protein n=1 Tax=Pseudonocardia spinosispora TaxID=103441 RepID=UPI00048F2CAF|nr:gamma carbonic anhydrase family protein [Pseudonocardia spinosispora]